jgi:glycosyltransferase involved in cell wall biosynthesis
MKRTQDHNRNQSGYVLALNWHVRIPGGVSQVVSNLSIELAKLGWSPTVLVNAWQARSPQPDRNRPAPLISWRVRSPWDERKPMRNLIAFLLSFPAMAGTWRRLAREQRWLVVNYHFPNPSVSFWLLLKALGLWNGAVVLSVHGSEVRAALTSEHRIEKALLRAVLTRADAIVACSAELAADVIALAPKARERVQIIPNGVNFDALLSQVNPDFYLPPELNLKPFILNVATYEPKKSQDVLIEAFSRVAARHHDVQLVIIGRSTPWIEEIRLRASASGFAERIHLLVDLPHAAVMNWLSRAMIFCLPSAAEGHPLAIMEAAAFELPVVATSIGGIREIIAGADEGLLVPVSEPYALAQALNRLIEDPETARNLGRNLRRSVESRYSWTNTAKLYSDLARSLLTSRAKA